MRIQTLLNSVLLLGLPFYGYAGDSDVHAADRQALRLILEEGARGINAQNIDLLARHVDETARVTWLNNEVSIGPQGVRDYYRRMVGQGAGAVLNRYVTTPAITDGARFYADDVAVANGTMEDEFTPHSRGLFHFHSRWSATLIKREGGWKIVALNFSTNAFDNVLIDELKQHLAQAVAGGFLLGVLSVGAWGFWRRRKPV